MARLASGREALSNYHVLQWNSLKVTHQAFFIFACFDQNPPYKSPSPSCRLSPSPLVISLRGGTGPAPTPTFSEIRSRDQYSTRRARTLVITSQKLKIGHNLTKTDCQEDCTWSPRSLHSLLTKVVTFLLNLTFLTVFAARDPRSNWIYRCLYGTGGEVDKFPVWLEEVGWGPWLVDRLLLSLLPIVVLRPQKTPEVTESVSL